MNSPPSPSRRKSPRRFVAALAVLYLILLIPDPTPPLPAGPGKQPFAWNQDVLWSSLEAQFKTARAAGCAQLGGAIDSALANLRGRIDSIAAGQIDPGDARFDTLETNLFHAAPMLAACPERLNDYLQLYARMREAVKDQSQRWDMNTPAARQRIYRLLYGGRAALEEVMLQAPPDKVSALLKGRDEPSQTPATNVHGVTLHSGDILVSRGGAPTSALIARGNDFPGNFSHIALLYVHGETREPFVIEAHIESGVTVSRLDTYLNDKKLRVMVLRPRADLPALAADPHIPHKAAAHSAKEARSSHIPYDFTMDYQNHDALFCSEVASAAYARQGVTLWMGRSHLSSPGLRAWLGAFGVRHFETQEPADLEYDPQLRVVAEWRNAEALWQDHIDNAVIDAQLEGAEAGERLAYPRFLLPFARAAKAWSWVLNRSGKVGPIPEGMNATAALKNKQFVRDHGAIKQRLLRLTGDFQKQNGYRPPYWELVKLARRAKASA